MKFSPPNNIEADTFSPSSSAGTRRKLLYATPEFISKYSDCTIVCEDGESFVRGVRCLLAASSPELDKLLSDVKVGGQVRLPISFTEATKLATCSIEENFDLIDRLEAKLRGDESFLEKENLVKDVDKDADSFRNNNNNNDEEDNDDDNIKKERSHNKEKKKKKYNFLMKAASMTTTASEEASLAGESDLNTIVSSLVTYVKDSFTPVRNTNHDNSKNKMMSNSDDNSTSKLKSSSEEYCTSSDDLGAKNPGGTEDSAKKKKKRVTIDDAGTGSDESWSFLSKKEAVPFSKEQVQSKLVFDDEEVSPKNWKKDALVFWGMQLFVFLISLPPWWSAWNYNLEKGGFFMDDVMIKRNKNVVEPELDMERILRTDYWGLEMFDPEVWTHKSFRPITVLSFRFDYQNFSFDSHAFHRHNVVLHFIAGLMCGWCAKRLLNMPNWSAALLSFYFLTHPVHTESLCYIVGRADLQCLIVIIASVLCYDQMLRGFQRSDLVTGGDLPGDRVEPVLDAPLLRPHRRGGAVQRDWVHLLRAPGHVGRLLRTQSLAQIQDVQDAVRGARGVHLVRWRRHLYLASQVHGWHDDQPNGPLFKSDCGA